MMSLAVPDANWRTIAAPLAKSNRSPSEVLQTLRSGVLPYNALRSSSSPLRACGLRIFAVQPIALALVLFTGKLAFPQAPASQAPPTNMAPALLSPLQPQSWGRPSAISDTQTTNPPSANPLQQTAKPRRPLDPCAVKNAGASMAATGGLRAISVLGVGETTRNAGAAPVQSTVCLAHAPFFNWYARFVTGPEVVRFFTRAKTPPRAR